MKSFAILAFLLPVVALAQDDDFTPVVVAPLAAQTEAVFGTDGRYHVVYELVLSNSRPERATLEKIEVLDDGEPPTVLATYAGAGLVGHLRLLDGSAATDAAMPFNETRLLLTQITFPAFADVPLHLRHRLTLAGEGSDPVRSYPAARVPLGARIPVVGPPLKGEHWVAFNGCCDDQGVHRRAVLPVNGRLCLAQRYAIDWMRLDDSGHLQHGEIGDVKSYTSYGAEIIAVADGIVTDMLDALEDQVPPKLPDPKTITLANIDGNHVVQDIGGGFYAFYAHMQKGSVAVKVGDRVRRGQVLGRLGNSGNTSAPHLHFHIMDGPSVLGSNGLPYVIDSFALAGQVSAAKWEAVTDEAAMFSTPWGVGALVDPVPRQRQYPLDLNIVNF